MKKTIVFIFLLHFGYIYAGGDVKVKGHKFVIVPFAGAIWQRSLFGDIALAHAYDIYYVNHHPGHVILAYSKLGAEFNFNFKHELWAPKVSSEIDLGFFCIRINAEDYISSDKNNFYLTPEFGVTLAGFITLTGGYNKPLTRTVEGISPFRASLNIMIPFDIIGGTKSHK